MHLTLLIADLVPPKGFLASPLPPTLDRLIQYAELRGAAPCALEDAVLTAFGWEGANAPVAALTHLADHGAVAEGPWLRADPVHMAVSRDNVQLWDSHVVNPTPEEMAALSATINAHLASDGLSVEFLDPARGYLRWTDAAVATTPLWKMHGASVFDQLPKSSPRLRQLTNELQMLLHDHPVNQAREARGLYPINGLWCWGMGTQTIYPAPALMMPTTQVVARLALARGCAMAAALPFMALPTSMHDLKADPTTNAAPLVVLHQATRELRKQSPEGWYSAVAEIEQQWLAPASDALEKGAVETLTLILPNESATYQVVARKRSGWQRSWQSLTGRVRSHRTLADAK